MASPQAKNDGIKLLGFLVGFGIGFGGAVGIAGGMSNFLGLFTPFGWLAASAVAAVVLVGVIFQKLAFKLYTHYVDPKLKQRVLAANVESAKDSWVSQKNSDEKKKKSSSSQETTHFLAKRFSANSDRSLQLIIAGDRAGYSSDGIGKSALFTRFMEESYSDYYKGRSTGVDIRNKTIQYGQASVKLRLVDTACSLQELNVSRNDGRCGYLVVYDMTDFESFMSAKTFILEHPELTMVLVGTKADLKRNQQVYDEETSEFVNKSHIPHIKTSAKTGQGVDEAFKTLTGEVLKKLYPAVKTSDPFDPNNAGTPVYKDMVAIAYEKVFNNYLLKTNDRLTMFGLVNRVNLKEREKDLAEFKKIFREAQSSVQFIERVISFRDRVIDRHKKHSVSALVGITSSDFADCLDDALKEMSRKNTTFAAAYRANIAREARPPVDALTAAFEEGVISDSKGARNS
jgi:Ras-related protein Rab-1A